LGGIEWNKQENKVSFILLNRWLRRVKAGMEVKEKEKQEELRVEKKGIALAERATIRLERRMGRSIRRSVSPRVYVFTLANETEPAAIHAVEGIPDSFTVGQVVFTPSRSNSSNQTK